MNKLIYSLIFAFIVSGSLLNAKEIKQPDTYAYTRGVEAYNNEEYQNALDWFNREIADNPNNGYAFVYIANMRYGNQEYRKALTAIDEALKHLPKKDNSWRSMSYASRAEIYAAMEDTIKAISDLNQAIKIEPTNPRFYNTRAQIYYEQSNYPLSDADYQKMIELDQGNVMGYMGIGRNANAQEKWEDAKSQFDYVIKLAPDYSSGYSFRAQAYIGQNKWTEATDDIIKALDIDGDDKAFYMMQNLPEEALDILIPKLKIQMAKQPTNAYWPYCIAQIYYGEDDYKNALEYLEKANKIDANSFFLRKMASCYRRLGKYNKALECIDSALNINEKDYDAIDSKASILSSMGNLEEAVEVRNQYLEAYPESSLTYISNADDKMDLTRFAEALEDYNKASALLPFLEEVEFFLIKRGDAYNYTGQKEKAYRDYNKVIELEKDSILSSSSWRPFAYSGLGNKKMAEETMLEIIKNNNYDNAGDYYNLACIYARNGEMTKSLEALRQSVSKGYDNYKHSLVDYDLLGLRTYPGFYDLVEEQESEITYIAIVDADLVQDETGLYETVEVPFTKEGGITKVQCTINGLPLYFVFDTGAADVTLSLVEANFMLKNDYIKPQDIIGAARYIDANGDISEGTVINLRNVNFGGLELDNVRASVVRNQKAPLLLGQSVLGRLGKIEIDNPGQMLKITHRTTNNPNSSSNKNYEIPDWDRKYNK